jgi:CDP-diacylglycerol---glycerol-3-phosphate 3-phosphatidyltransferase
MQLPNFLTIIRMGLSPLFILFFMLDSAWSLFVCLVLFGVLEITDLLDGHIARRDNLVTVFGKLMDPFADSIARFTIFLSFLHAALAPLWIIAIFFYRDVLVSIIRVFAIREGVVVSARQSGKIKAWFQAMCILVVLTLLFLQKIEWVRNDISIAGISIFTIAISIAALYTLYSAVDYWNGNKTIVLASMTKKS